MKKAAHLIFSGILIAVLLSSLGGKFWLLDLFSHFYLIYWLVLAGVLNVFLYYKEKFFAYLCALVLVVVSLELGAMVLNRAPMVKTPEARNQVRLLEYNSAGDLAGFQQWLPRHAGEFDVIVLLGAQPGAQEFLEKVKSEYPFQNLHLQEGPFGLAVLSRWEIVATKEFQTEGGFYPQSEMQIKMPSGEEFLLYALHAPPPLAPTLAEAHEGILGELAEKIAGKRFPALVVGDLNTTARSHRFTKLVGLTHLRDTAGISPWANTWPSALVNVASVLGIRIDHCLVSNSFSLVERQRLEDLGSNHLPVKCVVQIEK